MKYKVPFVTLLTTCLFTGYVFASSNEFFKGYNTVNVSVDGKKIVGDVPAINFDGRTMVPIRFVSEALGANVKWNEPTSSVEITTTTDDLLLKIAKERNEQLVRNLEIVKDYNRMAEQYRVLYDIGKSLVDLGTVLEYASIEIKHNGGIKYLDKADEIYSPLLSQYNTLNYQYEQQIEKQAKEDGKDTTGMKQILSKYNKSITDYNRALDSLHKYYDKREDYDFKIYTNTSSEALAVSKEIQEMAFANYQLYLKKIQETK